MYYILTLSLPFLSLAFSSLLSSLFCSSIPLSIWKRGCSSFRSSPIPFPVTLSSFLCFLLLFLFFLIPLQCLQCNNQYWPAIDLYFTVLLALKDYYGTVAVNDTYMYMYVTLFYFCSLSSSNINGSPFKSLLF